MAELPTVDEALGSAPLGAIPTVDEAFGDVPVGFTGIGTFEAEERIYQAFKGSAVRAFGDESLSASEDRLGISDSVYEGLRKSGFWNDYAKGQNDIRKHIYERTFRAAVGTIGTVIRAGEAALAAPVGAVGQLMQELGIMSKEDAEAAAADPGVMMALGPFGEYTALQRQANARRAANLRVDIPKARANGVLAEGEVGYFEAKPLTPENAQARVVAAQEAGIPAPVPEPVAPDVHTLARRVNPPVFEQYDALEVAKSTHRTTIQTLAQSREALPEHVQAQEEITTILGKVHGVESRLTKKAAERLADAQARLDAILSSDTPEMAKARKALLDADIAQRDLVPDVTSAYRQAREMMPPVEAKVAEVTEELSAGKLSEDVGLAPSQRAVSKPEIEAVTAEPVVPPRTPTRTTTELRSVQGTGPLRTRGLSEGIEAKAIESSLTESFGDLPEYHQLSMADQAARAADYIAKSPEDALEVAMGRKAPPRGVLPESILVAVEKQAVAAGDLETLRQLATESKLTTAATTMGQRIRTLGERDPTSPVGAIHAVQEARRAALEAKQSTAFKDVAKEIRSEIRRNAPTRDAWMSFLQEIQCAE